MYKSMIEDGDHPLRTVEGFLVLGVSMSNAQRFAEISRRFQSAWQNTREGIFADKSSLWRTMLDARSNFPTYDQFSRLLSSDSAFSHGIGMGLLVSEETYAAR